MWALWGGCWGAVGPGVSCVLLTGRSAWSAPRATTTQRTAWRAPRRSRKPPRRHEAALCPGEARWGPAGSLSLLFPFQTANARDMFLLHTCLQPALLLGKDFGCCRDWGASGGWDGANCLPCPALGPEGPGVPCRGFVLVLPVLTSPHLKAVMLSGLAFQGFAHYVDIFILDSNGKVAECISLSPEESCGGSTVGSYERSRARAAPSRCPSCPWLAG